MQKLEVKNIIFRPDIYIYIIFKCQKKKFETIIHVKKIGKKEKFFIFTKNNFLSNNSKSFDMYH